MELEKLRLEKDKIINLQNNYFEKILKELTLYKQQITVYKEKLEKAQNNINELNIELKLSQEEIINKKIEIDKLRSELIKAEDEIYNLTQNNPYSKLELIKDLKEVYIQANDDEAEELLDEILDGIDIIEEKISYTDMIFIMYLCYIYDRLQVLLSVSAMANSYYSNQSKEVKLLKIVSQEENSKVYNNVEECTQSYIEKNSDLFKDLDIKIKERIIETLYDMSYKYFNSVEIENNIDKNDKTISIKAWVKEENNSLWKLVNGIYSDKNKTMYLSENLIKILGVKVQEYDELYNNLLDFFIKNNLGKSLLIFNKIIENTNALKYYNRMQSITLLFIGYLIKRSSFGAQKIINSTDIGISYDVILYKRLSEGRGFIEYLTEHRDSLNLIDPLVKGEIIVRIIEISKVGSGKYKTGKVINQEEYDSGNLNAESEIKKMGYSTSLTREERWNILKNKAIPRLGKYKVMGHISFLIKMNKGREIMSNAVNEWTYDLERLRNL